MKRSRGFYRRGPASMGFVWLAPLVQLVGGAMQSHSAAGTYIEPTQPTSPLVIAAGALGGLAVAGGLVYLLWKA